MKLFEPDRSRGAPSLVDQTVAVMEAAIRQQVLRPGMTVPSVRRFARLHGLSAFTVSAAYARLVAQNWLVARPGSGHKVAPSQRRATAEQRLSQWEPPQIGAGWLLADVFADHSIPIKAGCGWLPPDWLNREGLQQSLRKVAGMAVTQLAGYGHPYGYFPLRTHIQQMLESQGLALTAEQVLLTQGATQALDIVVRSLLQPGDIIAVEVPCYANFLQTLRLAGAHVVGVPRGPEGIDTDALEALLRGQDIKLLFVNTVLQNPTGTTISMSNAFRLLLLAEQYGFRIIEDDVSRDLYPGIAPMLAAMAGLDRVIYISGFSKSIMPSLRTGYMVAEATLLMKFAQTKMALGLTTPEVMERATYQVLRQGRYRSHVQQVRDRLALAHDEVTGLMDAHGFEVFATPQAGLFLWARPPGRWRVSGAAELAQQALQDGIWLAPGSYFDPQQADTGWLRFNVAYSAHPALWRFMRRITGS